MRVQNTEGRIQNTEYRTRATPHLNPLPMRGEEAKERQDKTGRGAASPLQKTIILLSMLLISACGGGGSGGSSTSPSTTISFTGSSSGYGV